MKNFGLQMYALNKLYKDADIAERLNATKRLGYAAAELCGFSDCPAKQVRKIADDTGIDIYAMHASVDGFSDSIDECLEYVNELGCQFIVYPYAAPETADNAAKLGEQLGKYAEKTAMAGLRFCYHNHGAEFKKTESGEYMYDIIMQNTSELTEIEFDVGWIKYGGADPYDFMRRYAGRVPLIHMRQLNSDNIFCGLNDAGTVDLKSIKVLGDRFGTEYYIAEFSPENITEKELKAGADYLRAL